MTHCVQVQVQDINAITIGCVFKGMSLKSAKMLLYDGCLHIILIHVTVFIIIDVQSAYQGHIY